MADKLLKSDAVAFFNWVKKGYFEGMNGFVPHGWGGYASGYTIEKLYDKYIESLNKQD